MVHILYMEDDAGAARLLQKRLKRLGYEVDVASNGEEGLARYETGHYDALAIDQSMPVMDGLEVIRALSVRGSMPPIVMVTGAGDEAVAVEAMKLGASDYIVKDFDGGYLELLPTVLEQALQRHQIEAEKRESEAERTKLIEELDAFSHTVAHDLKNPLTVIFNYTSFMQKATLSTEEMHECVKIIEKTATQMRNIIDELLLLSQVRKMDEIEIKPIDMGIVVLEAHERLLHMMKQYQAKVNFPDEWPLAMGYAPWVEEVWVNYLSNAMKYGGIPPCITLGSEALSNGQVRFWVRDNGEGLTEAEQNLLFTPFTRLSQARAQGHGLGLSIVQRIVERLGGTVGVVSQKGKGSEFSFTLPGTGD